jgi:hypothetical protein
VTLFRGGFIMGEMKRQRRRKCLCCGEFYWPEYRNAHHQKYCPKPACRAASKRVSQRRWLKKPDNHDEYCGSAHIARVRAWRQTHPGYWRVKGGALQDLCSSQPVDLQYNESDLKPEISVLSAQGLPLQDLCLAQDPLFVGFVAHLTGALREDIASQIVRFQAHGQAILGKGPGFDLQKGVGSEKRAKAGCL